MRKRRLTKLGIIAAITIVAVWSIFSSVNIGSFKRDEWRLGLDLRGGTQLIYEADTTGVPDVDGAMKFARDIIESRINAYGVNEPQIQIQGSNRITVQLPGVTNIEEALKLIGQTANLDFRKLAESATDGLTSISGSANKGDLSIKVADTSNLKVGYSIRIGNEEKVISTISNEEKKITLRESLGNAYTNGTAVTQWIPATGEINGQTVQLTGKFFKNNAAAGFEPNNVTPTPVVTFELSDFEGVNGAELFSQITGGLIQKPLGIFLDNKWISSPTVQNKITGGSGIITGLDLNEAKVLAIQINQGALPLSLKIVQQENVGATLGADSLRKSLFAGYVGVAIVMLFMILYYRLPGLLASISLGIYAAILLAIFKLVPVTLSLAGIAAFILSIGMAVDANVLIFERMKEELMKGRTIGGAIDAGFHRAWSSIKDSNLTTLLACVILYFFGKQLGITMVMGFALTLLIGVIVSMFTAIIVTRTFMDLLIGTSLAKKAYLFYAGSVPKNQKETITNV